MGKINTKNTTDGMFMAMVKAAMTGSELRVKPTDDEWTQLFRMSKKHAVVGLLWSVVCKHKMPMTLAVQWASEAEQIRGLNGLMNDEAARLTEAFRNWGIKTVILKGQANARLYNDPLVRQPGDIDIWVEGGKERVMKLLIEMGFTQPQDLKGRNGKNLVNYHHVHLPKNDRGVDVEVHFRPSSGNHNPLTNKCLQRWLETEVKHIEETEDGFSVPLLKFALVMQLAHIQHHFLSSGIGLRQICDYFLLLEHSTADDRQEVKGLLNQFGLRRIGGALMWVLAEVFGLDNALMLCKPDKYRGKWLLRFIMAEGNFGYYAQHVKAKSDVVYFLKKEYRRLKLLPFAPSEMVWLELMHWKDLFGLLPERIRRGRLSLRNIQR
ncbi:nucleotidyltransferase domain-containing protein [Xylanibacter ruminicola]|nr:nucleotidyltransferase family protein [Xylanibacter ruminicola]